MDRRRFLSLGAIAVTGGVCPGTVAVPLFPAVGKGPGSFDFLYFTDTHIQPELNAAEGCAMAFRKMGGLKVDFAIQGGDHVYDVLGQGRERAKSLYDLYGQTERILQLRIHHVVGNHDVFGVYRNSGIEPNDAEFGKKMYVERVGRTYYSFDHKGYHFIILDTIQITEDRSWEARIDPDQLQWLKSDLRQVAPNGPIIVVTHVPLVTGAASYAAPRAGKDHQGYVMNAFEVLSLFAGHNVLGVLQGHTHINEVVSFRDVPYVTCGAVCGNWWHGPRLGTPEGFTRVSLRDGKMTWRYETYGFHSVDPQNS